MAHTTVMCMRRTGMNEFENEFENIFLDQVRNITRHGGYIKDCNGNDCYDGIYVIFSVSDLKSDENKGMLRWDVSKLMFMIETDDELRSLIPAGSVSWFKRDDNRYMQKLKDLFNVKSNN